MKKYNQPYSVRRTLQDSIRADKQHLECAPLGPIQKKRLQEKIKHQQAKLKEINKYIKEEKEKNQKLF